MANKNKLTTKPTDTTPQTPQSAPLAAPTTDAPTKRDVLRIAKHLAGSAIETALQYIWVWIAGGVVTGALAIWFALTGGNPLATHALAYAAGWFSVMLLILFLAWRKSRRLKALEQAKNLEFASQEKGYLDHKVNQARAQKEFNSTINAMGKVITRIGNINTEGTKQIERTKRIFGQGETTDRRVHKIAGKTATKVTREAVKLEQHLTEYERIIDLWIESSTGFLTWYTPTTEQEQQELIIYRTALTGLLTATQGSVASMEGFLDSQNGIRGISQELNTAVNRLTNVTRGIIEVTLKAQRNWEGLINLIDEKLNT